ncbi:O-methyltransferase, family 2 [Corchorus olitorius]|uniref:O-methyltransferase, family 2 n=1 Tax=Corchorus olitorius TaxID=93759 RepID=A0A1R3IQL8_9ROSI|nr:O-methyltransferase, family 2 [Corchorus olitorius]
MDFLKGDESSVDELLQAQDHIWNHLFRFISSMSLKCAVELEIPDIIHNHGQSMTISELAWALSIHPTKVHCLRRLMCILVHSGFFTEHDVSCRQSDLEKGYKLTLSLKLLLKDNINLLSARPLLLAVLDPILMKPWQHVSAWFQNDDDDPSAFSIAYYGQTLWDYAAHEPRLNHLFNDAMSSDGLLTASVVLSSKCRGVFAGLKSLVDVGGGLGTMTKLLACKEVRT